MPHDFVEVEELARRFVRAVLLEISDREVLDGAREGVLQIVLHVIRLLSVLPEVSIVVD